MFGKNNPVDKARNTCKKKFLYYFPKGFDDAKYYAWERGYKWEAHLAWEKELNKKEYERLLSAKEYHEAALRAVRLETKTNLLFSFEKTALRDAVKSEKVLKHFQKDCMTMCIEEGHLKSDLIILRMYWTHCPGSKHV